MEETWKMLDTVESLEGLKGYAISTKGNLKSYRVDKLNGRLRKTSVRIGNGLPYEVVSLRNMPEGVCKTYSIHRLIALAFNYNPDHSTLTVDHINEDSLNNKLTNLQWMTARDNIRKSQLHVGRIADIADVISKEYLSTTGITLEQLASKYKCSIESIWRAVHRFDNSKKRKIITPLEKVKIAEYYLLGNTLKSTGLLFNCCQSEVSLIVKRYKRGDFNDIP